MTAVSVESILDNEAKVKLLKTILKYPPDKSFRGRQLAELADVPKSTANRKLNELYEADVLERTEMEGGTTHLYSINEDLVAFQKREHNFLTNCS